MIPGPEKGRLGDEMARAIAEHVRDPREWPIEARRVAESLGLDVTRVNLYADNLRAICFDIVGEADRYMNKTPLMIKGAIAEIVERRVADPAG